MVRKTNELELLGIGKIKLFSIKQKGTKPKPINKEGEELKAEREGSVSYYYTDKQGNRYTKSEVFYAIGEHKIQKVSKTEQVKTFEIVDKLEAFDFLADSYYIVDSDDTTRAVLTKKLNGDKAIKFRFKKSSSGFEWCVAYLFRWEKSFILYTGKGKISEGIKEFSKMKQAGDKKEILSDVITIKSEDLEQEIANLI